jgi:hypothetical protein
MVIYPRSVALSAGYDVYSQHYPIIHTRMRVTGTSAWQAMTTDNLHPATPLYITLAANVTNATTAWSVTVPAAVLPEIDTGQKLFWYCDGECVVGSLSGSTLTVSARGADGTMAAPHTAGASMQLLSAKVPLGNLAVGTTFDVQLSFGGVYAEVGGWSNIVSVTTWQQTAAPGGIDPASFTVNLDTDAWHLKWNPLPDASVRQYRILRYDGPLPNPGYPPSAFLVPGGATDLGLVGATTALIPANGVVTGEGVNFGISARNSSGLEGVVVWNNNTWVPQSPNPALVSLTPVPSGILFSVTDPAPLVASGFQNFVLYQADRTDGFNWKRLADFATRQSQLTWPVTDYGVLHTYQVVSRNWNNVESALDSNPAHGYWKFATSFGPSDQIPPNGNFEVPDAQSQYPLYWQHAAWYSLGGVTTGSPAGLSMGYAQSGGMAGSKCWHFHSDGGASIPAGAVITWYIISTVLIPYNRLKATWVDFWLKSATVRALALPGSGGNGSRDRPRALQRELRAERRRGGPEPDSVQLRAVLPDRESDDSGPGPATGSRLCRHRAGDHVH